MAKTPKLLPPVHPGEILLEDFMKPLRLTVNKLAIDLHVPATRIGEIVHQRRRITADTALRLARYFKTNSANFLRTRAHPPFWRRFRYRAPRPPSRGVGLLSLHSWRSQQKLLYSRAARFRFSDISLSSPEKIDAHSLSRS